MVHVYSNCSKNNTVLHCLLVIVAASLLFIPKLGSIPVFDWDEANFAEAAREMITTGDYLRVKINYEPFWEKPPLFFWLQALAMKIFGINEFAARFVNAFTGIVTLVILYILGKRLHGIQFGFLWVLAYAGSFLPHIFFKSAIIDPVFNLFIFLGIVLLSSTTSVLHMHNSSIKKYIGAGVFIGLAVLTKGPVAFLIVLVCLASFWVIHTFRKVWSLSELLLLSISVAAVSLIYYGTETVLHGTWFMAEFIKYHLRLLSTSEAGHAEPFYYHAVVLLVGCFPASFFALRTLFFKTKTTDQEGNFLLWMKILFWVVLIVFSIVKTKTVLYSSLTYFPLTYCAAWNINAVITGSVTWTRFITFASAVYGLLVAGLLSTAILLFQNYTIVIPYIKDQFFKECLTYPIQWNGFEYLIGVVYAGAVLYSTIALSQKKYKRGFITLFIATALSLQSILLVVFPKAERMSQGVVVDFYKEMKHKGYVIPLFKSYVYLFYTEIMPDAPAQTRDRQWLLTGQIDKPAYFVCRSISADEYRGKYGLQEIANKYGYVFFERQIPGN